MMKRDEEEKKRGKDRKEGGRELGRKKGEGRRGEEGLWREELTKR